MQNNAYKNEDFNLWNYVTKDDVHDFLEELELDRISNELNCEEQALGTRYMIYCPNCGDITVFLDGELEEAHCPKCKEVCLYDTFPTYLSNSGYTTNQLLTSIEDPEKRRTEILSRLEWCKFQMKEIKENSKHELFCSQCEHTVHVAERAAEEIRYCVKCSEEYEKDK